MRRQWGTHSLARGLGAGLVQLAAQQLPRRLSRRGPQVHEPAPGVLKKTSLAARRLEHGCALLRDCALYQGLRKHVGRIERAAPLALAFGILLVCEGRTKRHVSPNVIVASDHDNGGADRKTILHGTTARLRASEGTHPREAAPPPATRPMEPPASEVCARRTQKRPLPGRGRFL